VFEISPDLAETLGVLLGDGCISRYFSNGREEYQVAFTASTSEYEYYEGVIQPTFEREFGTKGSLYRRRDNTTRYHIFGARLANQLIQLGIPVGKKLDASIPPAVLQSGQVIPFIRGIYHAEGSIYRRYSKKYNTHKRVYSNLLNVQIRMKLRTLMGQIHEQLNRLGIVTNRLTEHFGVFTLRITRQNMVAKFFEVVRPRYKTSPHGQIFNPP